MPHADNCSKSRENRQDLKKIILSSFNHNHERRTIAEALQEGGTGKYFCPDNNCRAEMVPRRKARNIPLRRETDEGVEEGFYDRRAYFAALPDDFTIGPRRERISLRREVIELIASHLRASGLYSTTGNGEPAVYTGGTVDIEINRRQPTEIHQAGWGPLAEYPVDIVATRTVGGEDIDFIIQVEENKISGRYGNSNSLIRRVRKLADPKNDKRKVLYVNGEKVKDLSRKVYQATVVLKNEHYFQEEGDDLTPTETVLLMGLFDNLLVFDMEQEALLIPGAEGLQTLPEFGFIETAYDGRDYKRFEEPVLNRGDKTVKIPELRIARAVPIFYSQETGQPVNQDSDGPLLF